MLCVRAREQDNEFNQKSVDALLNFETVKYFNAEQHEERRYDEALKEYTVANTRTQQSLAILNAGQNLIISFGIALALYLAARQVVAEDMTVGDFVMVQAFILQLYSPLGFLGTYYRMVNSKHDHNTNHHSLAAHSFANPLPITTQ